MLKELEISNEIPHYKNDINGEPTKSLIFLFSLSRSSSKTNEPIYTRSFVI